MPPSDDGAYAAEIEQLRARMPEDFRIGYSGDWCAAPAFLAGADAWHSVVAGVLPEPAVRLTQAAMAGDAEETARLQALCAPMWALFEKYGSLRTIYGIAEIFGLNVGTAPLPVQGYVGVDQRGGRVGLNRDRRGLSGSSAGCFLELPIWGVMQGGRSPTGVTPHIGGQVHAAIASGRLSKYA